MPLKTLVKVGNVTNLSDARYCSGMGVDMLGINVIPGTPNYLDPSVFQEIRGWISGPHIVAELYGLKRPGLLKEVVNNYRPDYLEVTEAELLYAAEETMLPLIVSVSGYTTALLESWKNRILYIQVSELNASIINRFSAHYEVIAQVQSRQHLKELLALPLKGLTLNGSNETRPGFKDYSELAEVLEELEVD